MSSPRRRDKVLVLAPTGRWPAQLWCPACDKARFHPTWSLALDAAHRHADACKWLRIARLDHAIGITA